MVAVAVIFACRSSIIKLVLITDLHNYIDSGVKQTHTTISQHMLILQVLGISAATSSRTTLMNG